jgi:hypothetical protein
MDEPRTAAEERAKLIRSCFTVAHREIAQAYAAQDWRALGHDSWLAYCETEIGSARLKVTVEERRAIVTMCRQAGMSTRAIADLTGAGKSTIDRDIQATGATAPNGTVISMGDGRRRPGTRRSAVTRLPEPQATEPQAAELGWHQLGPHRLWCGDSADPEFIAACNGAFAFADPPYGIGKADWDQETAWQHDWLIQRAPIVAVTPGIEALPKFLANTAMPYKWTLAAITNAQGRGPIGFAGWIPVLMFGISMHRDAPDHFRVPLDEGGRWHPTPKPVRLLTHLIDLYTSKGDTVVDPFLGSGTTLIAAQRLGRVCVGAEKDQGYCGRIVERYHRELGTAAA